MSDTHCQARCPVVEGGRECPRGCTAKGVGTDDGHHHACVVGHQWRTADRTLAPVDQHVELLHTQACIEGRTLSVLLELESRLAAYYQPGPSVKEALDRTRDLVLTGCRRLTAAHGALVEAEKQAAEDAED